MRKELGRFFFPLFNHKAYLKTLVLLHIFNRERMMEITSMKGGGEMRYWNFRFKRLKLTI